MAGVTYLIRMIPFAAFRKQIKSEFIKSILYYLPYAVLAAMTLPAILYSTEGIYSALAGLFVAVLLSFLNCSLIVVSLAACAMAFIIGLL